MKKRKDLIDAEPAEDYNLLKKQFNSLKMLCNSMENQLSYYRNKDYQLSEFKLQQLEEKLESEKQMNAVLTEELEKCNEQ